MLSMVAFNLVDTFFVSRLGTRESAAMGFTFPAVMFIVSIALGFATRWKATELLMPIFKDDIDLLSAYADDPDERIQLGILNRFAVTDFQLFV